MHSEKCHPCPMNSQLKSQESTTEIPHSQQADTPVAVRGPASTGHNAVSQLIQMQASAVEDEVCLLWFAYLDTRVLCVGMGVCAGSRFKRHGTDRTLVKDFTVTTLNVRLESRHVGVHDIAVHAAAERAEQSQCSPPHRAGHGHGQRHTHLEKMQKTALSVHCNNPLRINTTSDWWVTE